MRVDSERLRQLRQKRGYSQLELALEAGVSTATLWRVESAEGGVRGSTIERLAAALEVDPQELGVSYGCCHRPQSAAT